MKKLYLDEKCVFQKCHRGFLHSKGGIKANFSKMADFLGKLWKLRKICLGPPFAILDTFGNTSHMISLIGMDGKHKSMIV